MSIAIHLAECWEVGWTLQQPSLLVKPFTTSSSSFFHEDESTRSHFPSFSFFFRIVHLSFNLVFLLRLGAISCESEDSLFLKKFFFKGFYYFLNGLGENVYRFRFIKFHPVITKFLT